MEKVYIAYACDDNYIEQTGISLISLFENNKHIKKLEVFIIDDGIEKKNIIKIINLANSYNRKLNIIPFDNLCSDLCISHSGRHIRTIYAKIFFGRLDNKIKKILYLDSDVVINDKIDEFWNADLTNYLVAGVETISSDELKSRIGLKSKHPQINDGVLLMNLEAWRKNNIEAQCIEYIDKWKGMPPVLSEGTISYICRDRILLVNPKFNLSSAFFYMKTKDIEKSIKKNYYSQNVLDKATQKPVIIHYLCGFYNRPWNKGCTHPLKNRYLYYKSLSPWKDKKLGKKKLPLKIRIVGVLFQLLPYEKFLKLQRSVNKISKDDSHV